MAWKMAMKSCLKHWKPGNKQAQAGKIPITTLALIDTCKLLKYHLHAFFLKPDFPVAGDGIGIMGWR